MLCDLHPQALTTRGQVAFWDWGRRVSQTAPAPMGRDAWPGQSAGGRGCGRGEDGVGVQRDAFSSEPASSR